ncbi:DNA-binding response regulator, partial [Bacillus mycoides]|nr:DNA-binding response regulator [Bacillus mycoides]
MLCFILIAFKDACNILTLLNKLNIKSQTNFKTHTAILDKKDMNTKMIVEDYITL